MQVNNSTNFPEPITINIVGEPEIPDRIHIPGFPVVEWMPGTNTEIKQAVLQLLYEGKFEIALRRELSRKRLNEFRAGMLELKSKLEVLNNGN